MFEVERLFQKNKSKIPIFYDITKSGVVRIDLQEIHTFNGKQIRVLLERITSVLSLYRRKIKVLQLCFGKTEFADKLTYVMLECIIYALVKEYKVKTEVIFRDIGYDINTRGIENSLLVYYAFRSINEEEYMKKFSRMTEREHFRRLILGEARADSTDLCDLMFEIKTFLKVFSISSTYRMQIAEVISELADNAREHTKTDCLIDIDVKSGYMRDNCTYCALNFSIINFSEKCLCDALQTKIEEGQYSEGTRYSLLDLAYRKHSDRFCEQYDKYDFYNIASFQDRITGRPFDSLSGGTGLTELIKSLEENADEHEAYILSGNKGIRFVPQYLKYNEEDWIGFNESNDFLNDIPNPKVLIRSATFIPGTAYNFTLVVKQEEA